MNGELLRRDLGKDQVLDAVGRRRLTRRLVRSLPLVIMLAAMSIWISSRRGQANSAPVVVQERAAAESADSREAEIIDSDEELLSLLESFGPVLAKREDGTQVLVLTANGRLTGE